MLSACCVSVVMSEYADASIVSQQLDIHSLSDPHLLIMNHYCPPNQMNAARLAFADWFSHSHRLSIHVSVHAVAVMLMRMMHGSMNMHQMHSMNTHVWHNSAFSYILAHMMVDVEDRVHCVYIYNDGSHILHARDVGHCHDFYVHNHYCPRFVAHPHRQRDAVHD